MVVLRGETHIDKELIRGLGRFDYIAPVLIDLHWLPFPSVFLTRSVCLCLSV